MKEAYDFLLFCNKTLIYWDIYTEQSSMNSGIRYSYIGLKWFNASKTFKGYDFLQVDCKFLLQVLDL